MKMNRLNTVYKLHTKYLNVEMSGWSIIITALGIVALIVK